MTKEPATAEEHLAVAKELREAGFPLVAAYHEREAEKLTPTADVDALTAWEDKGRAGYHAPEESDVKTSFQAEKERYDRGEGTTIPGDHTWKQAEEAYYRGWFAEQGIEYKPLTAQPADALDASQLDAIRARFAARMDGSSGMSWSHDDIGLMLKTIDTLLAKRATPDVYAPPAGVCFTRHYTNVGRDNNVFEQHKARADGAPECGSGHERQPYMPDVEYELCPKCYPASATPPAVDVAAPDAAPAAKLTKAQQVVIDRLMSGWRINAPLYPGMTNWIRPDGKHMLDACPVPTLKALGKKGIVSYENGQWALTAAGRSRASEGGAK